MPDRNAIPAPPFSISFSDKNHCLSAKRRTPMNCAIKSPVFGIQRKKYFFLYLFEKRIFSATSFGFHLEANQPPTTFKEV